MKEGLPIRVRLTSKPIDSTLRREGNSMSDRGQEQPPKPESQESPQSPRKNRLSLEEARKIWGPQLEKTTDPNERSTLEMLIREGVPPISGGSGETIDKVGEEIIRKEDVDPALQPKLRSVNNLISKLLEVDDPTKLRDEYEHLKKELDSLEPPAEYTTDQKNNFEKGKQLLQSTIADTLVRAIKVDPKTRSLVKELAIEISHEDLNRIEGIINNLDNSDPHYAAVIGEAIQGLAGKDHVIKFVLEYALERIINVADINPKDQYPSFNYYQQVNLDGIILYGRKFDEQKGDPESKVFTRLTNLKSRRYIMHELFRSMKDRQEYVGIVTKYLRKDGLAFVEKEIAGVAEIQQIYEEVLGSDLSLKQGWLTDQDFVVADQEVEEEFRESAKDHKIKFGEGERSLRDWEIKRALRVGRSLNAATQRRITYGILGDYPEDIDKMIQSVEFEFIARILAPLKLTPGRFFSHGEAVRFIERFIAELKGGSNHKYGYIADGKAKGFYGKKQDSMAILDLGITDPKTNAWRRNLLFLKQKDFQTESLGGEKYAIGEYLDIQKRKAEGDAKKIYGDPNKLNPKRRHEYKEAIKRMFNDSIRESIANQRLFLGSLMRYSDLDDYNEQVIWQNVAELLPSRIASFMPEETLSIISRTYGTSGKETIAKWKNLRSKIWIAERARVKEDASILKEGGRPTKTLRDYFSLAELKAEEIFIIRKLQQLGKNHVATDANGNPVALKPGEEAKGGFIKAVFPFTAFLDDTPKTDWEQLTDEDQDRILARDQSNFEKGYGKITGLIFNPGVKPQDVIKDFTEAFSEISSPLGVASAQLRMEPLLSSYLFMSRANLMASWFGSAMRLMRKPRSEIEQYNLQAKIAFDATQQKEILEGLAGENVISDDPTESDKNGKTQMIRMEEEHDADRKAAIRTYIKLILLLLGPVAGKEFLKIILPGDFSKQLG